MTWLEKHGEKCLIGAIVVIALVIFVSKAVDKVQASPPETMTVEDWNAYYKRHRVEGKKLFELGKFETAIKAYRRGVDGVQMNYLKAGGLRNIALAYLLIAKRDNDKKSATEALRVYKQALYYLDKSDDWCKDGCRHVTDCTKTRETNALHIKHGSGAAKRWLKTGK